jgi:hypothetical protein
VRPDPELASDDDRIDPDVLPPCGFVTTTVNFAMMAAAQRDCELVTHLTSERAVLREPEMVSIRGLAATDQT